MICTGTPSIAHNPLPDWKPPPHAIAPIAFPIHCLFVISVGHPGRRSLRSVRPMLARTTARSPKRGLSSPRSPLPSGDKPTTPRSRVGFASWLSRRRPSENNSEEPNAANHDVQPAPRRTWRKGSSATLLMNGAPGAPTDVVGSLSALTDDGAQHCGQIADSHDATVPQTTPTAPGLVPSSLPRRSLRRTESCQRGSMSAPAKSAQQHTYLAPSSNKASKPCQASRSLEVAFATTTTTAPPTDQPHDSCSVHVFDGHAASHGHPWVCLVAGLYKFLGCDRSLLVLRD